MEITNSCEVERVWPHEWSRIDRVLRIWVGDWAINLGMDWRFRFKIKICFVIQVIWRSSFYIWLVYLRIHAPEDKFLCVNFLCVGNRSGGEIIALGNRLHWGLIFSIIEVVRIMIDGTLFSEVGLQIQIRDRGKVGLPLVVSSLLSN